MIYIQVFVTQFIYVRYSFYAFSALMLLSEQQEDHPDRKKLNDSGLVHLAPLMPLPPHYLLLH